MGEHPDYPEPTGDRLHGDALDLVDAIRADGWTAANLATLDKLEGEAAAADAPEPDPLAGIEADRDGHPRTARGMLAALRAAAPAPALAVASDWTGDPAPRAWLAREWLPAGRATLFTGAGGGGKSLLALQLAAGIASGDRNPLHCDPRGDAAQAPRLDGEPGTALFVTWEDEPAEVLRRLAWAGVDRAALGNRLHVADMAGRGPLWAPVEDRHRDTRAALTDAGAAVEDLVRGLRPRFAVIDPTAGAFAANENDRAAVRGWLSHLGALAAETGAALALIGHPPKDAQHAFSGSTDWRGGVRSLWTLRPETVPGHIGAPDSKGGATAPARGRALTLDKANYARDGRRAWLRLRIDPGPEPGGPPALMRWEECAAREAAEAYHDWRGWERPSRKADTSRNAGNGSMTPEQRRAFG